MVIGFFRNEGYYMKKHYDIGVVGCWYWGNYGSLLNGYATYQLLKSMGKSVLNIVSPYNGFEPHTKKFFEIAYKDDDISPVLPFERLNEYNAICDMFLTGSDQIWNYSPNKDNRRYDKYFRLDFVNDDKRKVSFATSFGKYVPESEEDHKIFEALLKRYNAISVREQEGVDILKESYNIQATQVLEPVLDIDKEYWYDIAQYSKYQESEQYLLTYILDPTPEKRKCIQYYSEKLGMKAVNILDGFSGIYEQNKRKLALTNTLPNIWCGDFLKYFSNAYFVITDSFHGACFSLVFNKPFIAVGNQNRGLSRFESLLGKVDIMDRLVVNEDIPLEEKFLEPMDFTKVNSILESEKTRTIEWLKKSVKSNSINIDNKRVRHVNSVLPEEDCMGCGACVSVCPVDAIELKGDKYGVYRAKIKQEKCISCGKCLKVCAALEMPKNKNNSNPRAYAFISADRMTHMESSSGGAFTALAKVILEQNGIVVGAAWNEDFSVSHVLIENKKDLPKLQKSKYFQSYMGKTFYKIKINLDLNRKVLFCGTPCQVAGLKRYLNKDYENLILVDLLCANCPSAGIFKKYLKEKNTDELEKYDFRYKTKEDKIWNAKKVKLTKKDGTIEVKTTENDDYLAVYHTCSLALSSQCLKCKYQGERRIGDLTIGDCWGIENYDKSIDVSKGVSVILVNNNKGAEVLNCIPQEEIGVLKEEELEQIKKYNVLAFIEKRNWPKTESRYKFLQEISQGSFSEAKEKTDIYLNELSPKSIKNIEIVQNSPTALQLKWDKSPNAKGYIIEQYNGNEWKRIAKIADANSVKFDVNDLKISTKYRFRIKAFGFDGEKPLYSKYTEIVSGEEADLKKTEFSMQNIITELEEDVKSLLKKIEYYKKYIM